MTDEKPPEGMALEGPIHPPPHPGPELPPEIPSDSVKNYPICGAKRRQQEGSCTRPAGWGTTHAGQGRCKLHGGSVLVKHGRYSGMKSERIGELIEKFENDPNPLDMTPELAAGRALFQDYVERYDAFIVQLGAWHSSYDGDKPSAKPRQILDVADANKILESISRIAKRIEDVKASSAISRADFYRVMTEMGRAVDTIVEDASLREKIHDAWMEIRLA